MMRSTVSAGLFWLILFFASNRVIGMRRPTVPAATRSAYAAFSGVDRMPRGSEGAARSGRRARRARAGSRRASSSWGVPCRCAVTKFHVGTAGFASYQPGEM